MTAALFIPLGQGIGRLFQPMPPLKAYALNLSGSLLGLLTYGFLTCLYTKPAIWFLLGGAVFLAAARLRWRQLLFTGILGGLILWQVVEFQGTAPWSPYHRISTTAIIGQETGQQVGFDILANQTGLVRAVDLSDPMVAREPRLQGARASYDFPYRFVQPKQVLVLGAGAGNDVAAALRAGVQEVDAVEIDPLILALGKAGHPENPFAHPAVQLHAADGRAFAERAQGRYDLIVLGFLDSQRLFSQFSSVRLDNFIYTAESFRRLRQLLASGGLLCVSYVTTREWLGARICAMLTEVFGEPPVVYEGSSYAPGDMAIFLSGPALRNATPLSSAEGFSLTTRYQQSAQPATDDWPYLYIPQRQIPGHYLLMILAILGVSGSLFLLLFPAGSGWNPPMFFMGAAFMLIETKAVTRVALLFGSTWTVNLWILSAVLGMALISVAVANRLKAPGLELWFLMLASALALEGWVKPGTIQQIFGTELGRGMASALAALPLLFSGVLFALLFRQAAIPRAALGWNLLGAMIGGLLEYASLAIGLQALTLVIAALYWCAFLTRRLPAA